VKYYSPKPKLSKPHLFVSNHTSVIDYIILSAHDFPHATVAQTHGGLIGIFEHSVLKLNGSLMFNRNEKGDRESVSEK
jgi:glycerol-3-phosphate O-acyltransferase 3/4